MSVARPLPFPDFDAGASPAALPQIAAKRPSTFNPAPSAAQADARGADAAPLASDPVRLLCGTPRGGKTGALLTEYAAALKAAWADGRVDACLWLTPNRLSRAAVRADLGRMIHGPLLAAGVRTFEDLTDDLLADRDLWRRADAAGGDRPVGPRFRTLSAVSRRRVLRAVIDEAAGAGRLAHFGRIAGTGGFLRLLERQVRAWKYAEVWPEHDSLKGGGPGRRDLVRLYAAYQTRLHRPPDGGPPLFDAEGRAWAARNLLRDAGAGADDGHGRRLDLLVADGFTSFTATQRDLLAELAAGAGAAVIALPLEHGSGRDAPVRPGEAHRPDLFAPVWETVGELLDRFAERDLEADYHWHAPRRPDDALGHLAARLFDESPDPPARADGTGLTLHAAGRISDEVRTAVAGVKRLLLDETPADRVVVTARDPRAYADEFFRLCDAAGVPVDAARPRPLAGRPAVRSLLAPWRVEAGDWPYRGLLGVLRDPAFGFGPGLEAATAVARVLRFANVGERRRTILKAARTFAPKDDDADAEPKRIDRDAPAEPDRRLAAAALAELDAALEPARTPGDPAAWGGRLRELAAALRFAPAAGAAPREAWEDDAADVAAAFELLDAAAAERAADRGGEESPMTLAEFLGWADELLAAASVAGPPAVAGGVAFVDAETARTAGCDHLFLLGLGEGQFPRPPDPSDPAPPRSREDENDAAALADAAARAEMLLFFGVVTRPSRSLTLSWPTRDDKGRELHPGPFVAAVRDLFAARPDALRSRPDAPPSSRPDAPPVGNTGDGRAAERRPESGERRPEREPRRPESNASLSPVPHPSRTLTAADARVLAVSELRDGGQAGPLARLLTEPDEAPAMRAVLGAAAMLAARTATAGPTAFDGRLSAKHRRRWAARRPARHQFSTSELETFAANPFRYFLDRVLGVDRPDPPGLREDPMSRGNAMHAVLARAHRRRLKAPDGPPVLELLREEIAGLPPRRLSFARWHDGLWETERALLTEWADAYPAQADAYAATFAAGWDGEPAVTHLEAAFGSRTPEEEEGEDLSQRLPAALFPNESGGVPITGRIDRVDAGTAGGAAAYNVVDYKTGTSLPRFTPEKVAAGASLQLALYAVAARRCGLVPPDAEPRGLVYWGVKGEGPKNGVSRGGARPAGETLPTLEADLDAVVPRLAAAIRDGVFPVCPEKHETTLNAAHARVGRAAEVRGIADRFKKWPPPWRPKVGEDGGDDDE